MNLFSKFINVFVTHLRHMEIGPYPACSTSDAEITTGTPATDIPGLLVKDVSHVPELSSTTEHVSVQPGVTGLSIVKNADTGNCFPAPPWR